MVQGFAHGGGAKLGQHGLAVQGGAGPAVARDDADEGRALARLGEAAHQAERGNQDGRGGGANAGNGWSQRIPLLP